MKYLITSALPYINGIKHLGNLVGCMLPADVYTRYLKMLGEDAIYICATDEHGTPAEIAAKEAGQPVDVYCTQQHELQHAICSRFAIDFDYFGRTSALSNIKLTQHFAAKLQENGFLEKRKIMQMYSIDDGRFLPDRYIQGTCPHCGSDRARGDQCDSCGELLDPTELIEPYSTISGSHWLEQRETWHLFLKQSVLVPEIEAWVAQHTEWPDVVKQIALGWIHQGLKDRCITRDLSWGVPVLGDPDLQNKVFYVWFDAPIGYISATQQWASLDPVNRHWEDYWYGDRSDVYYVQFMGKDNVPFHTASFPATILGTREPWKTVDYIKGFHWMNYYGDKFSTSRKYGIFMNQAIELYPADYWRYFLMSRIPEERDSSFTWEEFASVVNSDLGNVLGNLVNRLLQLIHKQYHCFRVPASDLPDTELETRYVDKIIQAAQAYLQNLQQLSFREAIQNLRLCWTFGNEYLAEAEPWKLKDDPERSAKILLTALNMVAFYAVISSPVIPQTCQKIQQAWNVPILTPQAIIEQRLNFLPQGQDINNLDILFSKIDDSRVEELKQTFGYK